MCHSSLGGSARIGAELSIELARRGHRVHLFTRSTPFGIWNHQNGVVLHQVLKDRENDSHPSSLHVTWTDEEILSLLSSLLQVISEEGLDLIHFHYALPFARIAWEVQERLKSGSPMMVGTLHGTDVSVFGQDPRIRRSLTQALQKMHALTTVSLSHSRLVKTTFSLSDDPFIIPNFVNLTVFCPRNDHQPLVKTRALRIAHVSNFRPVKNLEMILRIFADIRKKIDARLWLIGDGPEMAKAQSLTKKHHIEDDVLFWGLQHDVAPLLSKADLFLVSSQYESFCLAALEAMACGVPVLAPDLGGLSELIIHGKTGYLYPLNEHIKAVGFATELASSLFLYQTMRQECVSRARLFCHTQIVSLYEELYQQLLDQGLHRRTS